MSKTVVQVMYPTGGSFNWDYYLSVHMPMAGKELDLISWSVMRGIDAGAPVTYQAIAALTFESAEIWEKSFARVGPALLADIPNYTSVTPTIQVSTVIA